MHYYNFNALLLLKHFEKSTILSYNKT